MKIGTICGYIIFFNSPVHAFKASTLIINWAIYISNESIRWLGNWDTSTLITKLRLANQKRQKYRKVKIMGGNKSLWLETLPYGKRGLTAKRIKSKIARHMRRRRKIGIKTNYYKRSFNKFHCLHESIWFFNK